MAGKGAPSFLKRQKERNRNARTAEKRARRQARRDERAAGVRGASPADETFQPLDGPILGGVDGPFEESAETPDDPAEAPPDS